MLHVFLGHACNKNCSYCMQDPLGETSLRKKGDPEYFAEHIRPTLIDKGEKKVAYWGGEPLLYWDSIKEIHERLKDIDFDHVRITTNGTLLHEEFVNTVNRWGALVVLSMHDGVDIKWEQFRRIARSSITFIFSEQQKTCWEMRDFYNERCAKDGRDYYVFPQWNLPTAQCDPKYNFTMQGVDEHIAHLNELVPLYKSGDLFVRRLFDGYRHYMKTNLLEKSGAKCYNDDILSVDLFGNRYSCHHSAAERFITENVFQKRVINILAVSESQKFYKTKQCQSCELLNHCGGGCFKSVTHDVDCYLHKNLYRFFMSLEKV